MNLSSRQSNVSRRARRRGIALIFVLGCLAMIVIAAVSFASFMKVERMVAGQSLELSRARQAALAGLERALDRLNRGAGAPDFVYDLNGAATNYWPRTDVFYRGGGTDPRFSLPTGRMHEDGSKPFLGMDHAAGIPDASPPNIIPDYFTADLLLNTPPSPSRTTGAAVSIIANVSGRIDLGVLNNFSAALPRSQLGNIDVSSITTSPDQAALVAMRANALDYFTMPEIRYFPSGSTDLNGTTEPNFTFFEQACQQYRSTVTNGFANAVYIGPMLPVTAAANAAFRANLLDALLSAGVPTPIVQTPSVSPLQTTFNVVDYIDQDFLPSGSPNDFCGEPIPLLNELNLRATQTTTSSNITSRITLQAEFNFPFARNAAMINPATGANNNRYKLRVTHLASTGGSVTYTPTDIPVDPASTYWSYSTPTEEHKVVGVFSNVEVRSPTGTSDVRVQMAFDVLDSGNVVVDRVGTAATPIEFAAIIDGYNFSREVFDGRFNFAPAQWATFIPTGTLGAMNSSMTTRPEARAEYPYFVRNNPMESACELGHIGLGDRPWQSISLITDTTLAEAQKVHRVLDTFTVHLGAEFNGTPVTVAQILGRGGRAGPLVRGLVGLNTDKAPVLQALMLNGDAADRYPGDPGSGTTIAAGDALTLANNIITCRRAHNNSFIAKSRLGEALNRPAAPSWSAAVNGTWNVGSWTENQYESLLRQFMDLGDVRGNTFVVLVRGYGVIDNGPAYGPPLAGSDALTSSVELAAHVWRDPQTRRTMIRSLKWVDRDDVSIPNL